jgi:hypothetical protein
MRMWDRVKSFFDVGTREPKFSPPRLDASSETALSRSIRILPHGDRGWITMREARTLFSPMDDLYAFGDMDEQGRNSIAAFAAQIEHRSTVDFMPIESRVYFTRMVQSL